MHLGTIKITYNRTAQPRCYHNAFYGRPFCEPRRGGNSDFAMTNWRFWISDCKYVLLQVLLFAIDCSNAEFCASCVCVCVLACVWEGDTVTQPRLVYCKHIRLLVPTTTTVSVTRLCSPLGLELMVKLRTLLTVFTFILKAKARDYRRGLIFPTRACGVRPITMHCVSWPIRADCACRKEGLCRKWSVWERRGIEDLQ